MIVDLAVYEHGKRLPGQVSLVDLTETVASCEDAFAWIGLHEPTASELEAVAAEFALHPLAVEDAVSAHQRPKLERYGNCLFLVLKPARYVDPDEIVQISEIMVFVGDRFVITVRHGQAAGLSRVREALESDPERLRRGPVAVVHAIADHVVDRYAEVLDGLELDIDQIQVSVFSGPAVSHAERIFRLKREVLEFRQAVVPLDESLRALSTASGGGADAWIANYFRDVHDHVRRASDRLATVDLLLSDVLNANVAQVGMRQNEDVRKISAWAAIITVPTMIAGVYGMNFDHMPELGWHLGYPVVMVVMLSACYALYRTFKRRDWL